jgi:Na+-driven multidrug efflux pump
LLSWVYARRLPIAATPRQLFNLDLAFAGRHLRLILLVFINEFLWALGVNVYNAVMARLGTSAYAGYNIASTLQGMGLFFAMGCATTCAILVGHSIGAGQLETAYQVAGRILLISVTGSFGLGLIMAAVRQPLLTFYTGPRLKPRPMPRRCCWWPG